jgi:hypothetical protein
LLREAGKGRCKYATSVVVGEVAQDLFNRGLCLPSGTAKTDADLDRIISTIRRCRKGERKTKRYWMPVTGY